MAKISVPHRLYLYRLLSQEVGFGRQTMLTEVERVLAADDVFPSDLGCESVRDLMECLSDFVRVTVFRRGRVYATLLQSAELDALLAAAQTKEPASQRGGRQSWRQRKGNRVVRPQKPRPKGRPLDAADETGAKAPVAAPPLAGKDADTAPETTPETEPTQAPVDEIAAHVAPEREGADETKTRVAPEPAGEAPTTADQTTEPSVAPKQAEEGTPEPHPATEEHAIGRATSQEATSVGDDAPAAEGIEAVKADADGPGAPDEECADAPTVVADASEQEPDMPADLTEDTDAEAGDENLPPVPDQAAPAASAPPAMQASEPATPKTDEPEPAQVRPAAPRPILPDSIALEVLCANEQLSALYAALPFDVDPIELIDEDWQVARSTETYEASEGRLRYPLRYLRSDGQPVEVMLRRGLASPSGRRWTLEEVRVGDELDLWGLPAQDEGPWSHLTDEHRRPHELVSPRRGLARFAHLGDLQTLLAGLEELAEPEGWGEGRQALHDYLAITFFRVMAQGRLAEADGHVAFDTGLLTQEGARICMHFARKDEGLAFTHFSHAGEGLDPTPASYVSDLAHLTLEAPGDVTLSRSLAATYGDRLVEAARVGIRRALRNHRVATPAYDPQIDDLRLLVPVRLLGEETRALVLMPTGPGAYLATALLPLEEAYACARVVSAEQPRWLAR